jgi:diguanylate cyclase (GGDEF)-like protein/PAS domain S-box-containing protein
MNMARIFTPTIQISVGLISLTVSLILIAFSLGIIPNEDRATIEIRAKTAENLAVQIAALVGRNDYAAIDEMMSVVMKRDVTIKSIALRDGDGAILAGTPNHDENWKATQHKGHSVTRIEIPFTDDQAAHSSLEFTFPSVSTESNILGLSKSIISFISFIALAGFVGFFIILKRALRELDPNRAIPERVKAAFNTLAEGVLIMDEQNRIVLANDAFAKHIYDGSKSLIGAKAEELPWVHSPGLAVATQFPWKSAAHSAQPIIDVPMSIRDTSGTAHMLRVNATRISDEKGMTRGIIATFDDVTELHTMNKQLHSTVEQLQRSQETISAQNEQLKILATRDPLTGCRNRRSFFAETENLYRHVSHSNGRIAAIMIDVDHFKSINDRFGHIVGDKVLVELVKEIDRLNQVNGIVGRYGGEEFCVAVGGLSEKYVEQWANFVRQSIASIETWLPTGAHVTVSMGLASRESGDCDLTTLIKRADEALYAAKKGGRNRVVVWKTERQEITERAFG